MVKLKGSPRQKRANLAQISLVRVLEQEVTENEQTDKYRP